MKFYLKYGGRIRATLAMLFIAFAVKSQDFKSRLINMQKEYVALETAHLKMSIQLFETNDSQLPYFEEVAEVRRKFQNYYYQFGSLDMLMNDKYLVMVDNVSKEIVCSKRSPADEMEMFSDPFKTNMDSILTLYEHPRFKGKSGNIEHYSLDQKKGVIIQIDLFIDAAENVLKRMTYLYRDDHYVVIDFMVFDKKPDFRDFTFQESKYVVLEKGKLKAANNFREYNVVEVDSRSK